MHVVKRTQQGASGPQVTYCVEVASDWERPALVVHWAQNDWQLPPQVGAGRCPLPAPPTPGQQGDPAAPCVTSCLGSTLRRSTGRPAPTRRATRRCRRRCGTAATSPSPSRRPPARAASSSCSRRGRSGTTAAEATLSRTSSRRGWRVRATAAAAAAAAAGSSPMGSKLALYLRRPTSHVKRGVQGECRRRRLCLGSRGRRQRACPLHPHAVPHLAIHAFARPPPF
jgi:hypothetical protein